MWAIEHARLSARARVGAGHRRDRTANPTAMFLSAVMMLEWLAERHGLPACNEAAEVLRSAVERPFQQGRIKPFEFGGSSGTAEITRAVVDALRVNAREH